MTTCGVRWYGRKQASDNIRYGDGEAGPPISLWKSEGSIQNELFERRYLHYDDWDHSYGLNWDENLEHEFSGEDWIGGFEGPLERDQEDEAALKTWLKKIAN